MNLQLKCELQQDQAAIHQLLDSRRSVTMETQPFAVRTLWSIYLTILEDAVRTLDTLIQYLASRH